VFSSKESAEAWISKNGLTGALTKYPVDIGMYDYATSMGHFEPSRPEHETALFTTKTERRDDHWGRVPTIEANDSTD
jgi:hypothetical protein